MRKKKKPDSSRKDMSICAHKNKRSKSYSIYPILKANSSIERHIMGRSFYTDEEDKYSVPGLPTVAHIEDAAAKEKARETSSTEITINKFGNLITTSPALEGFVSEVRKNVNYYYDIANEKYEYYTGTAKAHFNMTAARLYEFKGEDEQLLPNGCSVLTATLFGSIVSRNHAFPVRFFTPLLFGGVALRYALPQTYRNVASGFENLGLGIESKYFPEFTKTREESLAQIAELKKSVENVQNDAWNCLVDTVAQTRKSIGSLVEKKD